MTDVSGVFLCYAGVRDGRFQREVHAVRVLLADSSSRVRTGLRALLEEQPDLQIVGEVADARRLLAQVDADRPNLLVLGWELPGSAAAGLLPKLRETCPDLCVIVLSGRRQAQQEALSAGADAFVSKMTLPEHLLAAITAAQEKHRRLGMTEVTERRRGTWMYAAIIAVAVVGLAAIAACLTVSLTLINEIPFHHIVPW
jgi:DNA-binding response OmpR family regulator